jgi:hypothetical protein
MPTNANDGKSVEPVGLSASQFLKECGYSMQEIGAWSSRTQLLHDMRLCGDDAIEHFQILHKNFGVDLSNFNFDKYFPSETSDAAATMADFDLLQLFKLSKIAKLFYRKRLDRQVDARYPAITLEMIDSSIRAKAWIFD